MQQGTDIQFGITLMTMYRDNNKNPEAINRIAKTTEKEGLDGVFEGEHIAFPAVVPDDYPHSETGEPPFRTSDSVYDLFQVLVNAASLTKSLTIAARVCVVPYHHPIILAKKALTIDSLSNGRFEFGIGVGWLREEFEMLGIPFQERGSRTDEFLRIFQNVCEHGEVAFSGSHYSFKKTGFYPRPVQRTGPPIDGPPIMIGGFSGATFRRIAEFGDGWTISKKVPEEIEEGHQRLMNAWEDYDRKGEPLISVKLPISIETEESPNRTERFRHLESDSALVGAPPEIIDRIHEYIEAGVSRIVLEFDPTEIEDQTEQITVFSNDIMPYCQ